MIEVPKSPETKKINPADLLKTLYGSGADQMYEEETGERAIVDGARTQEAQQYVNKKLAPIDFNNRQNWQKNANLESDLAKAASQRLKNALGIKE